MPESGLRVEGTVTGFDEEDCERDDLVADGLSDFFSLSISKICRVDLSDVTAIKAPDGEKEMEKMAE